MPAPTGKPGLSSLPTAAETLSILAKAMAFKSPGQDRRATASAYPPPETECAMALQAYRSLQHREVRQAVLDVLIAAAV